MLTPVSTRRVPAVRQHHRGHEHEEAPRDVARDRRRPQRRGRAHSARGRTVAAVEHDQRRRLPTPASSSPASRPAGDPSSTSSEERSVTALALAQRAADNGSDTGIIVAAITAAGVVLAALVSLFGLRMGARLDAIEKSQGALGAAIDRLERRMEDGLARLAERVDRLYGSATARPAPTTTSEDLERFKRFIGVRAAPSEEGERFERSIAEKTAGPTTSTPEAGDDFMQRIRDLVIHAGEIPPDPGPRSTISAAELNAELEFLRRQIEAYTEQERQQGTPPTETGDES